MPEISIWEDAEAKMAELDRITFATIMVAVVALVALITGDILVTTQEVKTGSYEVVSVGSTTDRNGKFISFSVNVRDGDKVRTLRLEGPQLPVVDLPAAPSQKEDEQSSPTLQCQVIEEVPKRPDWWPAFLRVERRPVVKKITLVGSRIKFHEIFVG